MTDKPKSEMLPVMGLWRGKPGGKVFASGRIGNLKVLIFENVRKQNDRSPDYNVVLVKAEDKPRGQVPAGGYKAHQEQAQPGAPLPGDSDDTPF